MLSLNGCGDDTKTKTENQENGNDVEQVVKDFYKFAMKFDYKNMKKLIENNPLLKLASTKGVVKIVH